MKNEFNKTEVKSFRIQFTCTPSRQNEYSHPSQLLELKLQQVNRVDNGRQHNHTGVKPEGLPGYPEVPKIPHHLSEIPTSI